MIPIILGTRGSALAQAQTRLVRDALKKKWPQRNFEIHIIRTSGDQLSERTDAPEQPGKGLFTVELEQALLEKKIHLAVHSLKDLPTEITTGLTLAAIPARADARDVLITRGEQSLAGLPLQAKIATGSPRRSAQILLARRDVEIVDIRGNIDTRLRKFRETPGWSAIILAAAGLERLKPEVDDFTVSPIPMEVMLPAPGQGALALQTRATDSEVISLAAPLHDALTGAAVKAERMLLEALGGGCREPIAAYAQLAGEGILQLDAVAWLFGEKKARHASLQRRIADAERLGIELAVEISR